MVYVCGVLALMVAVSCIYLVLGWLTVCRFQKRCQAVLDSEENCGDCCAVPNQNDGGNWPAVAQIKPLHRADVDTIECISTFVHQDYPGGQKVVLASSAPLEGMDVEALQGDSDAELSWSQEALEGTNRKIAAVAKAAERVTEDYVVLSDADMIASPDLLRRVVQPFADDKVGMVTCLYIVRRARTWGDALEGINVADFAASVLVARQVEGISFGLGAVMAMRRQVLEELGGFPAFKDYLADDYQLGNQMHNKGYKVVLADTVVEDVAEGASFAQYFMHQLRWMRTYRVNRPGGYFAYIVTQGMFWALLLVLASGAAWWSWAVLAAWMLVRACWCTAVWRRLTGMRAARFGLLAGVKDIIYVVLWLMTFCSTTVVWNGERFKVAPDGKMVKVG